MSNYNMSAIKSIVNRLGLECQLIAGANPLTCKYIMIQGKQLKTSQWTKAEAEAVLIEYKEGCKASQLPFLTQVNTDTNNLKELIYFKGQTLTSCLEEYRKLTETSNINKVNSWVETMTDFFTNEISNKTNVDACANKIKSLIDSKQVIILNNFVYTSYGLKEVIKTWLDVNNIKVNINYNEAINKYIKAVEAIL